ncbi:VCBS repeat-containing protein, partial [candidate division KSB1 bacterium]|nr:VCBS repeat-containing protein [candidate division KSB1 bacterium]
MINCFKKKSPILYFLIIFFMLFSNTDAVYPTQRSNVKDFKWGAVPFPYNQGSTQFLMLDSLDGWAFSEYLHQLYQYDNGNWSLIVKPDNIDYIQIFGFSKKNVWLGCFEKNKFRYFLRHFNGTKWSNIYPPNTDRIKDLAFVAADNIWGACEWGEIIHYNGKVWQLISTPTFGHLTSIAIVNDSLGWATGEYRANGTLMLWNGSKWKKIYELKKFPIDRVLMVNSEIGWVFIKGKTPTALRIERDKLFHTNFSNFLQDTMLVSMEFFKKPTVFYFDKAVTQSGDVAYTDFNDNKREILFSLGDRQEYDSFLFCSDGSVSYLQRKPDSTYSESKLLYAPEPLGNRDEYGVAYGDFDIDGDEDFYVINTEGENRLNLYNGNQDIKSASPIHFVNAADELNILGVNKTESGDHIYDMGVSAADVDNDGDREIYISCLYGKNQLHENINGKRFREIANYAGVTCGTTRSNVGIWGDVDNDGDVDLFVTNEDTTNMLFLNDGAGQFREITSQSGLTSSRGGKGATFGDLDLDGDLDLMAPYFSLPNRVYRNDGINEKTGLPSFTDVTKLWLPPGPDSLAKSASATLTDVDNDGDLDLFIANLVVSNRLYENDGSGRFKDITKKAGLLDSSLSHHGCFFDADNDGDLDLYVTNRGKNLFFENQNGKKFVRATKIMHNALKCRRRLRRRRRKKK